MHTFTKFKYHYNVEVPYNIAFIHRGPIPSFYVANLESQNFSQTTWAPRGPGVGTVKKLHKIKTSCFEVPYNFAFMHLAWISTFYLANLWS